jgi:hypothetical protein
MQGRFKLLLIDCDGQDPEKHERLAPFLKNGWRIDSIEPRIVEPSTAMLLVRLNAPDQPRKSARLNARATVA